MGFEEWIGVLHSCKGEEKHAQTEQARHLDRLWQDLLEVWIVSKELREGFVSFAQGLGLYPTGTGELQKGFYETSALTLELWSLGSERFLTWDTEFQLDRWSLQGK